MKIFVAGATGAIGTPLVRQLLLAGHEVIGLTRTAQGADSLSGAGVTPVVADALDRPGLLRALEPVSADVVVHQLTSLTKPPARHGDMARTNLLRTEGTENLLEAARRIGAKRFVTQSITLGYGYREHGDTPLTEASPFGEGPQGKCAPHVAAMVANERMVRSARDIDGIALRYGLFYGGDMAGMIGMLRKRRIPIAANTERVLPWVHVEDAATATVLAVTSGKAGQAYNVVDDLPCSWGEFFSAMAAAFGAPAPRALPAWLIRAAAPYAGTLVLDTGMRVSNAKAKQELHWQPAYPTHREGFEAPAAAV